MTIQPVPVLAMRNVEMCGPGLREVFLWGLMLGVGPLLQRVLWLAPALAL